jgi:hypothetical protein
VDERDEVEDGFTKARNGFMFKCKAIAAHAVLSKRQLHPARRCIPCEAGRAPARLLNRRPGAASRQGSREPFHEAARELPS